MWAALVFQADSFGRLPWNVSFAVRMNASCVPDTADSFRYDLYQLDQTSLKYLSCGFLSLQNAVMTALSRIRLGVTLPLPSFRPFPLAAFTLDTFQQFIRLVGAIYMVMGFTPLSQRLAQQLVLEKERRTAEGMKMMGLGNGALICSWFVTYLLISCVPLVAITVMAFAFQFYSLTSPLAFFLLCFLFVQSMLLLSFLFAKFFDKAKTVGSASFLLLLVLYLPYYAVAGLAGEPSFLASMVLSLSAPIAFSLGFSALMDGEAQRNGVMFFENMRGGSNTVMPFWVALLMLVIDSFLYVALTHYLELVWFGEFGISQAWHYPCSRHCKRIRENSESLSQPLLAIASEIDEIKRQSDSNFGALNYSNINSDIEPIDSTLPMESAVDINQLTKNFGSKLSCFARCRACCCCDRIVSKTSANSSIAAVSNLSLTFYLSQISVILGHNGAGKSTLVSLLTGLFGASSGVAKIFSFNVATQMSAIRRSLGVCPQYDILFDQLTVREHLEFFADIKGVPSQVIIS